MKSQSHSCEANFGPNSSSCSFLQSWFLSGWTDQWSLIVLKLFVPSSAFTHVLWKKLPIPFGVDKTIALPPVANVCCADAHISSTPLIKAASSMINNESASDLPASPELETAFIWEPFLNLRLNLLSILLK